MIKRLFVFFLCAISNIQGSKTTPNKDLNPEENKPRYNTRGSKRSLEVSNPRAIPNHALLEGPANQDYLNDQAIPVPPPTRRRIIRKPASPRNCGSKRSLEVSNSRVIPNHALLKEPANQAYLNDQVIPVPPPTRRRIIRKPASPHNCNPRVIPNHALLEGPANQAYLNDQVIPVPPPTRRRIIRKPESAPESTMLSTLTFVPRSLHNEVNNAPLPTNAPDLHFLNGPRIIGQIPESFYNRKGAVKLPKLPSISQRFAVEQGALKCPFNSNPSALHNTTGANSNMHSIIHSQSSISSNAGQITNAKLANSTSPNQNSVNPSTFTSVPGTSQTAAKVVAPISSRYNRFGFRHDDEAFLEAYINTERFSYNSPVFEFREQVGKLLNLLAKNNYSGYLICRTTIANSLGEKFEHLIKFGINYLPYYIIHFGATNFLHLLDLFKINLETMNLFLPYVNMIYSKPYPVMTQIMKVSHWIPEKTQKIFCDSIRIKYPSLHPLNYFFFESTHLGSDSVELTHKILMGKNNNEKLHHLQQFLELNSKLRNEHLTHFCFLMLSSIPISYQEFFMNLPIELKFFLAKIAVIQGDIVALVQISELVPELLVYHENGKTLLDLVVKCRKICLLNLFLTLAPEVALYSGSGRAISIYESLIIADDVEMVTEFESCGISWSKKSIGSKSAIQVAFEKECIGLVKHFIFNVSKEILVSNLIETYETVEKVEEVLEQKKAFVSSLFLV